MIGSITQYMPEIIKAGIGLVGAGAGAYLSRPSQSDEEEAAIAAMRESLAQSQKFANAAVDPNDPIFQNLSGLIEEKSKRDLATAINEMMKASRRETARGYGPLVNPSRRDEARSKAIALGHLLSGERARDEARNALLNASGRSAQLAPGFGGLVSQYANQSAQEAQWRSQIGAGIFDLANSARSSFYPTEDESDVRNMRKAIITKMSK